MPLVGVPVLDQRVGTLFLATSYTEGPPTFATCPSPVTLKLHPLP